MSNQLSQPSSVHIANASLTLSVDDVLVDLGGISPQRLVSAKSNSVRTATIDDLTEAHAKGHLCELVDGTLVEKQMGFRESLVAMMLGKILLDFVSSNKLGLVSGADGFIQLYPSLVRGPDVAFVAWDRLPGGRLPDEAYPSIVPNLVVEVISPGNTRAEMARKRREYFQAGVELVWMVDVLRRTVAVFTDAQESEVFYEEQMLNGGSVLPGLSVSLPDVFGVLDRTAPENDS